MPESDQIKIYIANKNHLKYVDTILQTIEAAAKVRGTGIAKRSPEYIQKKMMEGKAIIALHGDEFAGFCYIETWGHEKFVANSGLIVVEKFRGHGLAKKIKQKAFDLSRKKYPNAKLFGLTSGTAVAKINLDLGYRPVNFFELTKDKTFWKGCDGCVNYNILQSTNREHCICTGMLYDPFQINISIANDKHLKYFDSILETIEEIEKGKPIKDYRIENTDIIKEKMRSEQAVIAIKKDKKSGEEKFVGFCYIESWNDNFVTISGPIVSKDFRNKGFGLSKRLKLKAVQLSRKYFPNAKLFSLTPNVQAMKTNTELGYKLVPLIDLTNDSAFWKWCEKCKYKNVLERTNRRYCICKGMLYDPANLGTEKISEKK